MLFGSIMIAEFDRQLCRRLVVIFPDVAHPAGRAFHRFKYAHRLRTGYLRWAPDVDTSMRGLRKLSAAGELGASGGEVTMIRTFSILAAVLVPTSIGAAELEYSDSVSIDDQNGYMEFLFPSFNPALGDLLSATVELNFDVSLEGNASGIPEDEAYYQVFIAEILFDYDIYSPFGDSGFVAFYDYTDCGDPSAYCETTLYAGGNEELTFTVVNDEAQFLLDYPLLIDIDWDEHDTNILTSVEGQVSVALTYYFEPAPIPLPSSLSMAIAPLAGFVGLRQLARRRRSILVKHGCHA